MGVQISHCRNVYGKWQQSHPLHDDHQAADCEKNARSAMMLQFYHSGGIIPRHNEAQVTTLTLITDGKAVWMKWLNLPPESKK